MPTDIATKLARAALASLLLAATGCRDSGGEAELFELSGKLFVFNYRVATATYLVTLKPLGVLDEGQTAIASFENPAGGPPIEVRQKIWPKLALTTLESPPLRCVVKDVPYNVAIRVEDAQGEVRQRIETQITSSLDQSVLPDRPLVVGPAYRPNPELAGRPSGKLDRSKDADCPKRG